MKKSSSQFYCFIISVDFAHFFDNAYDTKIGKLKFTVYRRRSQSASEI